MKKIVLVMMVLLVVGSLQAQQSNGDTSKMTKPEGERIYTSVQIEAEFPGGPNAWSQYLRSNLKSSLGRKYINIPKGESSAKATVIVSFDVNKYGKIDSVMADSLAIVTIHPKIVEEALRVIRESPQWKPAWQNGKNVRYKARQMITFVANKTSFF